MRKEVDYELRKTNKGRKEIIYGYGDKGKNERRTISESGKENNPL